jgi:hypothetical protein
MTTSKQQGTGNAGKNTKQIVDTKRERWQGKKSEVVNDMIKNKRCKENMVGK